MTDFEVGDQDMFAGGQGETTKIDVHPNEGDLLHVYTTEEQLSKLPSSLPHIERIDSIVDRLTAQQIDSPIHHDLRERATGSTSRTGTTGFCCSSRRGAVARRRTPRSPGDHSRPSTGAQSRSPDVAARGTCRCSQTSSFRVMRHSRLGRSITHESGCRCPDSFITSTILQMSGAGMYRTMLRLLLNKTVNS